MTSRPPRVTAYATHQGQIASITNSSRYVRYATANSVASSSSPYAASSARRSARSHHARAQRRPDQREPEPEEGDRDPEDRRVLRRRHGLAAVAGPADGGLAQRPGQRQVAGHQRAGERRQEERAGRAGRGGPARRPGRRSGRGARRRRRRRRGAAGLRRARPRSALPSRRRVLSPTNCWPLRYIGRRGVDARAPSAVGRRLADVRQRRRRGVEAAS